MMTSVTKLTTVAAKKDQRDLTLFPPGRELLGGKYRELVAPVEAAFARFGATPEGLLWSKGIDLVRRYDATLAMVPQQRQFSLLDIGCGPGLLLDYLSGKGLLDRIEYHGVDISRTMIAHAQRRWPKQTFEHRDLLVTPLPPDFADYGVICGVFTSKFSLQYEEMESFVKEMLVTAWRSTRIALAFDVMSIHVDWTQEELFHWPLDSALAFCRRHLSRHLSMRADYGRYDYTVQVFRQPISPSISMPPQWGHTSASG